MVLPELAIVILNVIIVFVAYFSVYPKLAGNNVNKIAMYDLIASGLALFIVGIKFWGSDYQFSLIITDVNWFWFTLITYSVIEFPFIFGVLKKKS